MRNGADFKINVRDSGHAPSEGGAYATQSEAGGVGRVLRYSNTACLAEPRIPEQLLHATVVGHTFLARTMVAQRNISGSSSRVVGGLDTGYLAGKTIQRTEDTRRLEKNRVRIVVRCSTLLAFSG